jgi:hypothetical protein
MQRDTSQAPRVQGERHDEETKRILVHLPHAPAQALSRLPGVACPDTRRKLATLIAQCWARQDINGAWNAVTRSSLSAAEKQIMFNELWT